MKKIFSVLLLSLLLFSCNNEKTNNNEEIRYYDLRETINPYDSIMYLKEDMSPLNGNLQFTYYEFFYEIEKTSIFPYITDSIKNLFFKGKITTLYPTAESRMMIDVSQLKIKKYLNSYKGNPSTRILYLGNYIDGKKDGNWKFYHENFFKGYITAQHYENIDTVISIEYLNGKEFDSFLEEQGIDLSRDYKDEKYGKGYFIQPKIKLKGNYIKGVNDGIFTHYDKQGKITKQINWKKGKKEGLKKFYYKNFNQLKFQINYNGLIKNGEYRYWYTDSQLKVSGNYKNDKIHGKWKLFYKNGKTESEKLFKNGKLINEICYDKNGAKINCNSSWLRKNVDERFDLKFLQKRKDYINNYVSELLEFMEVNSMVFDINKAKQKLDEYSIEYSEGFNDLAKLSNEGDSSIVFSYLTNENEYDIMKYNVKFEDSKERLISVFKNKTKELGDNSTIQELIEHEVSYIARYYDVNKIDNNDELSNNSRKGILGEIIIKPEDW